MAFGLRPGVIEDPLVVANALLVSGDSSGMHVKVDTGRCGVYGHIYENDSVLTLPIGANVSGSTRTDSIVVQFDFAANTAHAVVKPGTLALTQNLTALYEVRIGTVDVPNGAATITAGNVHAFQNRYGTVSARRLPIDLLLYSTFAGTTDGSGNLPIPHSAGFLPRFATITPQTGVGWAGWKMTNIDATNLTIRAFDSAGVALAGVALTGLYLVLP